MLDNRKWLFHVSEEFQPSILSLPCSEDVWILDSEACASESSLSPTILSEVVQSGIHTVNSKFDTDYVLFFLSLFILDGEYESPQAG